MQLFGNQDVEIFVVAFQRREAIGIPADVKSCAQWIVACRNLTEVCNAAMTASRGRRSFGVRFELERAVNRARVGQQIRRKLNAGRDIDEEIREQKGQQRAGNFHDAARASPTDALRVVENWTAFLHEAFPSCSAAGQPNVRQVRVRLPECVCSIVRCDSFMKRIFSQHSVALVAGLCLRLFFVLKFPANSGDTVLYEQMATNWLQHHVYAMDVGGQITPVDLRMPGYPIFLAIVYAITGRIGRVGAPLVMIAQALVDLVSCVLIAVLAAILALMVSEQAPAAA